MRIFIGCTTQHLVGTEKIDDKKVNKEINDENIKSKNSLAFQLYSKLDNETTHKIMPWWNDDVIEINSDFFQRIQDLSNICEFGIFIFSAEDVKGEKNIKGKEIYGTSENVLIEYGLFLGKNTDNRTFQVFEKGVSDISDLIKYNTKKYDFENTEELSQIYNQINKKLEEARRSTETFAEYYLITNRETSEEILTDENLKKWKTKFLYLGRESANHWDSIEDNDDYISDEFDEIFRLFIQSIKLNQIDNVLSFGPGIGKLDEIITQEIVDNDFKYVPIDINPFLAIKSLKRITNNGSFEKIYVPTAIVDDFEENTSDLKRYIKTNITKEKHKTLFLMMGGTFGNLEKPLTFLGDISNWMDKNDVLIIDAYVKSSQTEYDFKSDKADRLTNPMLDNIIFNAVCRKRKLYGLDNSDLSIENLYNSNCVSVDGNVGINGHTKVKYQHKINDKSDTLLTSIRFNEENLTKTFKKKKFKICHRKNISVDSKIGLSRTIFVLKKKY